jgi:biopolymer transport protein ExbD
MSLEPVSMTTFEDPDFLSALITSRRRRRKVAKIKRESEEVNYLNIVAMMDMMTIILVFLLKSISFSTSGAAGVESILLPSSTTQTQQLEAIKVFVNKDTILVEDKLVARLKNSNVLPEYISKDNNYEIVALKNELDKKAEEFVNLLKLNPDYPIQSNLTVIADKDTPYRVLMQIFYSASAAWAQKDDKKFSFSKFRLTVLRQDF